jgi:hypothetical protein
LCWAACIAYISGISYCVVDMFILLKLAVKCERSFCFKLFGSLQACQPLSLWGVPTPELHRVLTDLQHKARTCSPFPILNHIVSARCSLPAPRILQSSSQTSPFKNAWSKQQRACYPPAKQEKVECRSSESCGTRRRTCIKTYQNRSHRTRTVANREGSCRGK